MTVRQAAPAAPAPVLASTIAREGLGNVDAAEDSTSVTFPLPGDGIPEYVPFSTAPVTMSRSLWDQAQTAVRERAEDAIGDAGDAVRERAEDVVGDAGAAVRERAGSAIDAVGGGQSSGAGAADKAFEDLYDRLKRELMSEQEQLGQLFHEP